MGCLISDEITEWKQTWLENKIQFLGLTILWIKIKIIDRLRNEKE